MLATLSNSHSTTASFECTTFAAIMHNVLSDKILWKPSPTFSLHHIFSYSHTSQHLQTKSKKHELIKWQKNHKPVVKIRTTRANKNAAVSCADNFKCNLDNLICKNIKQHKIDSELMSQSAS